MLLSVAFLVLQNIYIEGIIGKVLLLIAIVCAVLGFSLLMFGRWKDYKNLRSKS